MTTKTTMTCDGCGATAETVGDGVDWAQVTKGGLILGDLCGHCSDRIVESGYPMGPGH